MPVSRLLAALALVVAAGALSAQAPKPKFSAKQIADAEMRLTQANCSLRHEMLPPAVPGGPKVKGGVDIVAFPEGTTDADLAKLIPLAQRLPNLKTVDLGGSKDVTAKGFKEVAKLTDLQALFLDGCTVDAAALRELTALKSLLWLNLSGSSVGDDDMKVMADFNALRNLTLDAVPNLSAKGIEHLQKMVRLRVLHLTVEADPPGMMAEVGKLSMLGELRAYPVGDVEAQEVGNLTRLQALDLNHPFSSWRAYRNKAARPAGPKLDPDAPKVVKDPKADKRLQAMRDRLGAYGGITVKGFPHLLKCTDLVILKLAGHPIDVKDTGLDKLEYLQELDLSGTDFTDDGVSWLGRLKAVRKLWLSGTGVTTDGVKGLAVAGGLELVALDYLPITDEAIGHLARNRRLKELSLNETRVACADKKAWYGMNRLERVSLQRTNITDNTLTTLASLRTLKFVDVRDNCPNVTLPAADALERDLPTGAVVLATRCEVVFWPGGGGVPIPKGTREPDLNYRNPNGGPTASRPAPKPMAPAKPPPRPVRDVPIPKSGKP